MNVLYKNLPSQRMRRWRLLLEEFHPQFKHMAGVDNDAANALSRLEMVYKASETVDWGTPTEEWHTSLSANEVQTSRTSTSTRSIHGFPGLVSTNFSH